MWECAWGSTQNHSTGRFCWFYLPRSTAQCAAWSRTWSPYITVRSGGKCGAGWWLGSARSFNGVHPLQWNLRQVTINEWIILCQNTITTTTIDSQSMQCFANAWQKCWQGMFCMFVRPCSRFLQFVLVCYIYIYIDLYIYLYTVAEICISLRIDHCSASWFVHSLRVQKLSSFLSPCLEPEVQDGSVSEVTTGSAKKADLDVKEPVSTWPLLGDAASRSRC